jgi:hypothetical protein
MRTEIFEGSDKLGEVSFNEETFSTGSRGYYASTKLEVGMKRYQVVF